MDYYTKIQNAIDFIEENLTAPITLRQTAKKAYCSLFHFHRIFHAMVGVSVKEYIRKRRLSNAAHELICTSKQIIDIAFEYQYETPESFSRAFKKMFKENPCKFRKNRQPVLFEKINVLRNRSKSRWMEIGMKPKFITRPAFKIIGFEIRTSVEDYKNFRDIPAFWQKHLKQKTTDKIPNRTDNHVLLGICNDFDNCGNFSYIICAQVKSLNFIPEGMIKKIIPPSKYAVFTSKGPIPDKIQKMSRYIYETWFPNSNYKYSNTGDFELYDEARINSKEPEVDIYVPVK